MSRIFFRKKAQAMTSTSFTYASIPVPAPPPKSELKDLGLAIEPIVGLRSYCIDQGVMLASYNGTHWPHREPLYAECAGDMFSSHEVPAEACMCGIYAWRQDMLQAVTGNLYGEVYLWGDVLVCEMGYRAEVAYPKNLTIGCEKPTRAILRIRDGLEEAYGIPVVIGPMRQAVVFPTTGPYGVTGATGATPYYWYSTSTGYPPQGQQG